MMERAAISEINKAKRNFNSYNTNNDSSKDSLPLTSRVAMDVNDLKFDYKTLIIDENEVIEKQMKEKKRKDNIRLDPFMKEFLSRKGSN